MKKFDEIFNSVKNNNIKTIAVAAAEDEPVLEALKEAILMGLANTILVGDKNKIEKIAESIDFDISNIVVVDEINPKNAALEAVKLVRNNRAQIIMKGLLNSADFLKAVLNKEFGLRTGKILSHVSVFKVDKIDKLILMTDGGMIMDPSFEEKVMILENTVPVCQALEIEMPKAAVVCAVEVINPMMQPTMDAAALALMSQRGQIKNIIIDGPLALDNALSEESAKHKGIKSQVAGQADVLLMPSIECGNIMWKTLTYMGESENAGIVMGAAAPIVMTSRSDSKQTKLNSIALALLVGNKQEAS